MPRMHKALVRFRCARRDTDVFSLGAELQRTRGRQALWQRGAPLFKSTWNVYSREEVCFRLLSDAASFDGEACRARCPITTRLPW